ncbi:hypothetical protein GGR52DRAFT_568567 [Hypoxylon sp. FL1284]|nr:hypothetical protein GGR52DRAFT_568567 [Hypoxylon sp. FL1284]
MADKNNRRPKLSLFPRSTTSPDDPQDEPATRGENLAAGPTPRSVSTSDIPESPTVYKTELFEALPQNEVASSPSDSQLHYGDVEIDGKKRASFIPSALVHPLKLKTWPSLTQRDGSSRNLSWGVRFVSDANSDSSPSCVTDNSSPGMLLNLSPRFGRKPHVTQVNDTLSSQEPSSYAAADNEHDAKEMDTSHVGSQGRIVADQNQLARPNIRTVQYTKEAMPLPLKLCQQQLPSTPPSGPLPPVPQRPQQNPPLQARIATSQNLAALPRPVPLNTAIRAPNHPGSSHKGKTPAFSSSTYRPRSTSYTRRSDEYVGGLLTIDEETVSEDLETELGAQHRPDTEASTSRAPGNTSATHTSKAAKLLPIFENPDSSLEESSSTSPLSLHKTPRALDLPVRGLQAGPQQPALVRQTSQSTPHIAVVVEQSTMTNSRGSPTPPRRGRQSQRLSQALEVPKTRAPANPRREYAIREEAGESSRQAETRAREGGDGSYSSAIDATAMLREMIGDSSSGMEDASPLPSTTRIRRGIINPELTVSRRQMIPNPLDTRREGGDSFEPLRPPSMGSIVAASTPTKLYTAEFLRGLIHEEMERFLTEVSPDRVNRQRALAAVSLESNPTSLRSEEALRNLARQQVALHAPEVSAY